ncbi:fimbrial protein [Klebsiella pneumoniae]|uniref:fimbrial protein n=1 Tax=Klebsiella pneumoniae TaxID=573 RepID=UPI0034CF6E8C
MIKQKKYTHFNISHCKVLLIVLFCISSHANIANAEATGDNINVTFHGTLRIPPCIINENNRTEIRFETVSINKVDGKNYIKDIPYRVTCEATDSSWQLYITLKGNAVTSDNAVLQTNVDDVGIKIYQNAKPLEINKPLKVSFSDLPKLQAVPVLLKSENIKTGFFYSVTTLIADYQ